MSLWKDHQQVGDEIAWLKKKFHSDEEARGEISREQWLREVLTLRNVKDLVAVVVLAMVQTIDCLYTYIIVMAKMAGFKMDEYLAGIILTATLVVGYTVAPYFLEKFRFVH